MGLIKIFIYNIMNSFELNDNKLTIIDGSLIVMDNTIIDKSALIKENLEVSQNLARIL